MKLDKCLTPYKSSSNTRSAQRSAQRSVHKCAVVFGFPILPGDWNMFQALRKRTTLPAMSVRWICHSQVLGVNGTECYSGWVWVPCSWKYWRELNLVVWPKVELKWYWWFNLAVERLKLFIIHHISNSTYLWRPRLWCTVTVHFLYQKLYLRRYVSKLFWTPTVEQTLSCKPKPKNTADP